MQVNYTAAFIQAPIDHDPQWVTMTPEEKECSGVFFEMPRGFSHPGKTLKPKRSLYRLKQSPQKFFHYLKRNLQQVSFESQTDVDPCLFVSPTCIVLIYVDDTLFFTLKMLFIKDTLGGLCSFGMELEAESDVVGSLGVHMERLVLSH